MDYDGAKLRALIETVGKFHITERPLRKAQARILELLAREGAAPPEAEVRAYVRSVEAYFTPFEREARDHLRDVDRQLQQAFQVQFNLTAEREVAQRRIEATQGVLGQLTELRAQ